MAKILLIIKKMFYTKRDVVQNNISFGGVQIYLCFILFFAHFRLSAAVFFSSSNSTGFSGRLVS